MQASVRAEAEALVMERRGPELEGLLSHLDESSLDGAIAWAGGPPQAGRTTTLLYNKACGPLRFSLVTFLF